MMSQITRSVSRFLVPFIVLYGLYIGLHGHLTPGGGFPGGAIIAAGLVLLFLAYGVRSRDSILDISEATKDAVIALMFVVFLLTVALARRMPANYMFTGGVTTLFSGGSLIFFNVATAIEVALGFSLLCIELLRAGGKDD